MKKIYQLLAMLLLCIVAIPRAQAGVAETVYYTYGIGGDREWDVNYSTATNTNSIPYDYYKDSSVIKGRRSSSSCLNRTTENGKCYLQLSYLSSYTEQLFVYLEGSEVGSKIRLIGHIGNNANYSARYAAMKVSSATYDEEANTFTVGTVISNPIKSGYYYNGTTKGSACVLNDEINYTFDCDNTEGAWYCIDGRGIMIEQLQLIKCTNGYDVKVNVVDPQDVAVTDATVSLSDGETTYPCVNKGDGAYVVSLDLAAVEGKSFVASAYNLMYKGESDPFTVSGDTELTYKFKEENSYTLSINVVDQNNAAVSNANVSLTDGTNPIELTSLGNGAYSTVLKYSQIANKEFVLTVANPGCDVVTEKFTMEGDKNITAVVTRAYNTLDIYNTHPDGEAKSNITSASVVGADGVAYALTVDTTNKTHASVSLPSEVVNGKEYTLTMKPVNGPTLKQTFIWDSDKTLNLECKDYFTMTVRPFYRETKEPVTDALAYCRKGNNGTYDPELSIIMTQTSPGVYQYQIPYTEKGQWTWGLQVRYCNSRSGVTYMDDDKDINDVNPTVAIDFYDNNYSITVTVTDPEGNLRNDATVTLQSEEFGNVNIPRLTSKDGQYKSTNFIRRTFANRKYNMNIVVPGFAPINEDFTFEYNDELPVTYTALYDLKYTLEDKYYNINVNVVDEDNNPIEGAVVSMGDVTVNANEEGAYILSLNAREYEGQTVTINANAEGYYENRDEVVVDGDKNITIMLYETDPTHFVTFKLVDDDGNLIPRNILRGTTNFHVFNFQYFIDGKRYSIDEPDDDTYCIFNTTMKESEFLDKALTYYASYNTSLFLDAEGSFTINEEERHNVVEISMKNVYFTHTWTITDEDNKPLTGLDIPVTNTTDDVVEPTGFVESEPGVYVFARRGVDCIFNRYEATATKQYMSNSGMSWQFFRSKNMSSSAQLNYDKYKVNVTVTEAENGEVLDNATVTMTGNEGAAINLAPTATAGQYSAQIRVMDYIGQNLTVTASAPHYEDGEVETGELDGHKNLSIALNPAMHVYTVAIENIDGEAVTDASVSVVDHNNDAVEVTNNGDGTYGFAVHSLKAQDVTYTTTVEHVSYITSDPYTFSLADGHHSHTLTLVKKPSGIDAVTMQGNVMVKNGVLYVSGNVTIADLTGRVVRAYTNAEPGTAVGGLTPGVYIVNGTKVLVK